MEDAIYFSKIEYKESIGHGNTLSVILLNIPEKELSYQVFEWKRKMPSIQGVRTEEWNGHTRSYDIAIPAKKIRNYKTGFSDKLMIDDQDEQEVVFSYAIKFTDLQVEELLPYCNALDFEPFRDKKMSMGDEGCIGYRDGVHLGFKAITDSYIPLLELPMKYYYDENHMWPSEKLYRYLIKTYFEGNKKLRRWGPVYGGLSLFL